MGKINLKAKIWTIKLSFNKKTADTLKHYLHPCKLVLKKITYFYLTFNQKSCVHFLTPCLPNPSLFVILLDVTFLWT